MKLIHFEVEENANFLRFRETPFSYFSDANWSPSRRDDCFHEKYWIEDKGIVFHLSDDEFLKILWRMIKPSFSSHDGFYGSLYVAVNIFRNKKHEMVFWAYFFYGFLTHKLAISKYFKVNCQSDLWHVN